MPSPQPAPATSAAEHVASPPRVDLFFQKETNALGNSVAEQVAMDQSGVRTVLVLFGVRDNIRVRHGDYYLLEQLALNTLCAT